MVLTGGQLAGGNSVTQKADNDYYATDPQTVRQFFNATREEFKDVSVIWENACGEGNISKVIKECFDTNIVSTDLINRGYGWGNIDFLNSDYNPSADLIITNPPFSLINDFIIKGLEKTNRYLVYLCKIQMLETVARKDILQSSPLKYIYVHSKRQATWKNGQPLDEKGNKWATTMCLAWFVWEKGYKGEPIVRWL